MLVLKSQCLEKALMHILDFMLLKTYHLLLTVLLSQAARRGLAVLMASAVVVLKHETSTLRQRHKFISIDFKFGVGDYVREVTNPDKLVRIRWAVETPRGGNIYGYCDFFFLFFIFFNRTTAHTREPIFALNSSKDAVWCKEEPFYDEKCEILKFGGVSH